jgi:cytochrome c biogenesis protein CcmG, thiol:disulfide interchange protein DsbE
MAEADGPVSRALRLLPIILAVWILGTFAWRLIQPSDPTIRSQLVNRELPRFELPSPAAGKPGLRSADLATGEPRLLNLFASWCVPCIAEAPVLEELKRKGVKIDGVAIRDTPGGVAAFLERHGNPYNRIGNDPNSAVQFALGSAGVPETFVVDGQGVIRLQHIGPIEPDDVPKIISEMEKVR